MGQRLPGLSQGWADLVVAGNAKSGTAAGIRREGAEAFARGIQEGLAGVTSGIIQARAEKRRAAESKKADARWEAEFGLRKEEAQARRDDITLRLIDSQMEDARVEQMAAAQASTVPDPATGQPSEQAAQMTAAAAERLERLRETRAIVFERVTKRGVPQAQAPT